MEDSEDSSVQQHSVGRKAAVSGPVAAAVAAETESEGEGEV